MLWVVAWVNRVVQRPRLILAVVGLITIVAAWVAVTQFRMNSDLGDLIDQQSDWRADFDRFEAAFPDLVRTGVIVVRSPSIKQLELTTTAILDELAARPDYFTAIAAPGAERFFRDHAMLYMDLDDLDDMADRLAEAQPWLTAVAETNSLAGVLRLVADGVENDAPTGFDKVLDLLGTSLQRLTAGEDATIWWTDEMFASDEIRYQLIYVKAFSQFDVALPNAVFVAQLREVIAGLENHPDVDVWLTGELPLQHEEIEAAISGVSLAGWLSLALLFVVMLLGVRSGKIIAATFLMLLIGVIWTSALAMLTVGEYNTLSVVFIVMFFGLGVDFALHFSLRFQQAVNAHVPDVAVALQDSASSVGRAIVLCTLTTAIGFLGFVPTDYRGLADLGTISAGGMLVACFLALTFLPAFYMVSGAPKAHLMNLPTSDRVVAWLVRRRRPVVICVCIVGAFAAWQTSQAKFDYSTLALKDPNSQSMQALRLLQAEDLSTDYQLVVVREAAVPKARLEALEEVEEVRTLLDFVPDEQEDKLYVLEDLQEMLWSALQPQRAEGVNQADNRRATAALIDTLAAHIGGGEDPSGAIDEGRNARLSVLLDGLTQLHEDEEYDAWQDAVLANLREELQWLRRAVNVTELDVEDLPGTFLDRFRAADGQQLSLILPSEDIADVANLSAFITAVRGEVQQATGRPVIEWGVGGIVVSSFLQALVFACLGITLVLVVMVRNLRTIVLIFVPLLLAALLTFAFGVMLDQPINMANVLVLPLIFGLGVDNGIHVVDRYLHEGNVEQLIHSSTPRAVLLSAFTTIGAFAALSLSPHAGTASIGLLLTVAVGLLLFFTIFLLPVFLASNESS